MEKIYEKVFAIGLARVITLQEIKRALPGFRDTGVVFKQLVRPFCVLDEFILHQDKVGTFLRLKGPRFIPVRHLNTDEHTDHDDEEVDPDCEPVFLFDVSFDAAEDHGVSPDVSASFALQGSSNSRKMLQAISKESWCQSRST